MSVSLASYFMACSAAEPASDAATAILPSHQRLFFPSEQKPVRHRPPVRRRTIGFPMSEAAERPPRRKRPRRR